MGTVVINLGSILDDRVSLPNRSETKTAGTGEGFSVYCEFQLSQAEFVSAPISIFGRRGTRFPRARNI
jgi:hypothetical protein